MKQISLSGINYSTFISREETAITEGARMLREIELEEPLRYAPGDGIERWLNSLLCLDAGKVLPF